MEKLENGLTPRYSINFEKRNETNGAITLTENLGKEKIGRAIIAYEKTGKGIIFTISPKEIRTNPHFIVLLFETQNLLHILDTLEIPEINIPTLNKLSSEICKQIFTILGSNKRSQLKIILFPTRIKILLQIQKQNKIESVKQLVNSIKNNLLNIFNSQNSHSLSPSQQKFIKELQQIVPTLIQKCNFLKNNT